jgi:hypothetical protein
MRSLLNSGGAMIKTWVATVERFGQNLDADKTLTAALSEDTLLWGRVEQQAVVVPVGTWPEGSYRCRAETP